jgi:hypothetical protein
VVSSKRSLRQLRDVTTEELLREAFSVPFMPRCYKQEMSRIQLVVRQTTASKDVNADSEEVTELEAVTRQQPVKIQWTETTYCVL